MAFVNISATSVSQVSDTAAAEDPEKSGCEQRKLDTSTSHTASSTRKQLTLQKSYKSFDCGDKWWRNTVIYEVYVRSFYDSNNDGIGDLRGIEEKLDYFKQLGVDTLWLTPMYPSPMVDFGYDISDFVNIDPLFGTMDDFKKLLRSMKDKEMKLLLDFVPNHTSDQHEWFKMSILRQEPYQDYYVWRSPKAYDGDGQPSPPNNWRSVFGGSAWTYNETRKQYYLHQFAREQPDLNFRNPLVIQEMINVMNFWLELGVDGFRLDAAPHILEDEEFRDNPQAKLKEGSYCKEDDYIFWDPVFTCNSPGVLDILSSFRNVCDEWSLKEAKERVLLTEGYLPLSQLMEYYGTRSNPIAHFSFNFELLGLTKNCKASDAFTCITRWLDALPQWCCPNWQTGNHDQPRIATKLGEDMIDIMNMLLLLLPGVAVTYYGEELGMQNTEISWEQTKDPAGKNAGPSRYQLFSRDGERSPMQWDASNSSAGFSDSGIPWLPTNTNYLQVNVKSESESDRSHLQTYNRLVSLRKSKAWLNGDLDIRVLCDGSVLAFTRIDITSGEGILVATNFNKNTTDVDCRVFQHVPTEENAALVVAVTDLLENYNEGSSASFADIRLNGCSGIVCKFTVKNEASNNEKNL